jgi:hypothetical protein
MPPAPLEAAEIMLERRSDSWSIWPLERPYGRGSDLQIAVSALAPILEALARHGVALFRPVEERWHRAWAVAGGSRQFLLEAPDGCLLHVFEDMGERAVRG